jgi:hypothetical protein
MLTGSSGFAATEVVYFGGYGSTQAQMTCWLGGAEAQPAFSAYSFQAYPYPSGATASAASAVQHGAATIAAVVTEIDGNPNVHFVVAGHSSGAALSNRVAELVKRPSQIELVNLDGFAPSLAVQKAVDSRCMYGESSKIKGLESLNATSMKSNCLVSQAYIDGHCTTAWCMHFSLVNEVAPANLGPTTYKSHGYDGCKTNLSWLTP